MARDAAVSLSGSSKARLARCAVIGPGSNGINIMEESDLEITDSLIAAFWGTGIAVSGKGENFGPSRLRLTESVVRSCNHRGITLGKGCDQSVLEKNWISGSAWHGIRYDSASPRIERNVIFGNKRSGIYASGRTAATVARNLFAYNEMSGISCWYANQDKIVGNIFLNNPREALAVVGACKPVVQSNWFLDQDLAVVCSSVSGGGAFSESAGPPVMTRNLMVNVTTHLMAKGETLELPPGNQTGENGPQEKWASRLTEFGPAETDEQRATYTSSKGPASFLD